MGMEKAGKEISKEFFMGFLCHCTLLLELLNIPQASHGWERSWEISPAHPCSSSCCQDGAGANYPSYGSAPTICQTRRGKEGQEEPPVGGKKKILLCSCSA